MTDGNDYDGSLLDKKPNGPFYHLSQSDINKQPVVVANGHAGKAYFSFDADECLNDDNLNNKEYISVFIVYSLHDHPTLFSGLWGNENGGNDKYIAFKHLSPIPGELLIASGNTLTTLKSFPSKAHPVIKDRISSSQFIIMLLIKIIQKFIVMVNN